MTDSIFDGYPRPAIPGTITPGTMPKRPDEYSFMRTWYMQDLFRPGIHDPSEVWRKYIIPYEGELLIDTINRKRYIVTYVDTTTWETTYIPFDFDTNTGNDTLYPLYPKNIYGMLQGELPLLLDYSQVPPTAQVPASAYQSNPAYALLYYGGFEKENIISAMYTNNSIQKKEIDVVTVMPAGFNVEQDVIKCCAEFSVTLPKETLKNGTRCFLVYYDQDGTALSPYYTLMVQHSDYLRYHKLSTKYIKSIDLLSPWFTNSSTPNTLYLPVNLPLINVLFRARLNYSDGTSDTRPVNSSIGEEGGFTLHGINSFKPTAPNQDGALTLTYHFQNGEQALVAQAGMPEHMSSNYTLTSVAVDGAYSPRLYIYPYWTANGWKLSFWLGDLTRKFMIDVTQWVRLNNSSPAFSGTSYGVEQTLVFNLTLSEVSKSFNNWTFTQWVTITLYNEGTSAQRKWDVIHSVGKPAFENLEIDYTPSSKGQTAKFKGDFANTTAFLNAGYYAMSPEMNTLREEVPLVPNYMKFIRQKNGESITVPVGSFNNIPFGDWTLNNAETYFIAWIQRDSAGNELQLGLSAAITRKI